MVLYEESLRSGYLRLATIYLSTPDQDGESLTPSVTLKTYEFADAAKLKYSALSYTWGKPRQNIPDYTAEDRRFITLNGYAQEASPNLFDALHQLYKFSPNTPVWIDALCINQADTKERESQVASMGKIYGEADRVLIWLGAPTPHLMAGLETAERLAEVSLREIKRIIKTEQQEFCYNMNDMPHLFGVAPLTMEEIDGILAIFRCSWFNRVWIIQEVSLAKEPKVFCDGISVSFDSIGYLAGFIHLSGLQGAISSKCSAHGRSLRGLSDYFLHRALKIQMVREWCKGPQSILADELSLINFTAGAQDDFPLGSLKGNSQSRGSVSMILLKLILWSSGFQATDPRDSIYGLGGILQHMAHEQGLTVPERLKPNYDIAAAQVLEIVTAEIMEATGDLTLLSLAKDPAQRTAANVPSWSLDFRSAAGMNHICASGFKSLTRPNACGSGSGLSPSHTAKISDGILTVQGVLLGTVVMTAESWEEATTTGLHDWIRMLLRMDHIYRYTGQSSMEAFWRTLVWDCDFIHRPARLIDSTQVELFVRMWMGGSLQSVERKHGRAAADKSLEAYYVLDELAAYIPDSVFPTLEQFKSLCRKMSLLPGSPEETLTYDQRAEWIESVRDKGKNYFSLMGSTLFFRRPILTNEGHLGCSCESAQVGDEVWIISGCPTPLVLRKSNAGDGGYTLIGETYVHGVMNGEIVNNDTDWTIISLV
ncbi:Ff.00g115420.m01.CDS01 [Fusarium sp. VM40]|nr:Ff.00g115420.m01.CDS01 [Fusarium sp. VM40]